MDDLLDLGRIKNMNLGPMVANAAPMAPFDQVPSPISRDGEDDIPQPPTPQQSAPPNYSGVKPAQDDDSEDDASDAASAVRAPASNSDDSYKSLLVTKDDLDQANREKRLDAGLGAIGDSLSNSQSYGNFLLGHMNPHNDTVKNYFAKMADMANQPIEQKKILLQQKLNEPQMDFAMKMQNPDSAESSISRNLTLAALDKLNLPGADKDALKQQLAGANGFQIHQIIDTNPALKQLFNEDMMGKRLDAMMAGVNTRLAMMQERMNMQKDKAASDAGKAIEDNSIIKSTKNSLNSLKRSSSILDDPNKPVTTKDLNLAYNDYINAVAAGGAATEGKISRELPTTWETEWNELKQKAGINADLRKTPQGMALINMLKENIHTVNSDLGGVLSDQSKALAENYAQSSNPKVKAVVGGKVSKYDQAPADSGANVPKEGDTKTWNNKTYKVVGGHWVEQ